MPDIGMIELILIGLIGFLVLGPERLPEFLGQIAKIVRQGREWMTTLRMQLEQEKQQITKPIQQIKEEVESSVQGAISDAKDEKKDT